MEGPVGVKHILAELEKRRRDARGGGGESPLAAATRPRSATALQSPVTSDDQLAVEPPSKPS